MFRFGQIFEKLRRCGVVVAYRGIDTIEMRFKMQVSGSVVRGGSGFPDFGGRSRNWAGKQSRERRQDRTSR